MDEKRLIDLVGWLWIVAGIISLFIFFSALLIFLGVSLIPNLNESVRLFLRILALGAWAVSALFSLPQIVAGVGVLRRQEWARVLTLILSILALLRIPLGTVLGIFSLYVLTKREIVALFH